MTATPSIIRALRIVSVLFIVIVGAFCLAKALDEPALALGVLGLILAGLSVVGLSLIGEPELALTESAGEEHRASIAEDSKFDDLLSRTAKVIQRHLLDSERFASRLTGANQRLSSVANIEAIDQIVMSLIADNEEMQNKTAQLSTELAFARSQVYKLQYNLAKAEELGVTDSLTNVGNRRFFQSALAEEIERRNETGTELSLIMADIDHFKRVNDQFGHLVGDMFLKLFAELLTDSVRGADRLARYGGEEFAIVAPGTSLVEAVALAERIRARLETKHFVLGLNNRELPTITASFGVATYSPEETEDGFVHRADELLYRAKAAGRNKVAGGGATAAMFWADAADARMRKRA